MLIDGCPTAKSAEKMHSDVRVERAEQLLEKENAYTILHTYFFRQVLLSYAATHKIVVIDGNDLRQ